MRRTVRTAALAVVALLIAACGKQAPTPAPSSTGPAAQPAPTGVAAPTFARQIEAGVFRKLDKPKLPILASLGADLLQRDAGR